MPFIDVNIHFLWSTKNRKPLLNKGIRETVLDHIRENGRKKKIFIDSLGGYDDHLHALISLSTDLSMAKTVQLIKGESSFWVNTQGLLQNKFEWQDEYYAVSVSPNQLDRVRAYINNQEKHHQKKTFEEEIDDLMKLMGIKKFNDLD